VWRALRPGGWLTLPAISVPGNDFRATFSRLRNTLWGGGARLPEQVAGAATRSGSPTYKSAQSGAPCVRCWRDDQPDRALAE
jgi:hypothetical protein